MEANEKRGKRKKKQRDKTAARDYDPYFGDMTKVVPPTHIPKAEVAKRQNYAAQLQEVFPLIEKKLIDLMLTEHNNDFDLTVEALLSVNSDAPSKPPAEPVRAKEIAEIDKKLEQTEGHKEVSSFSPPPPPRPPPPPPSEQSQSKPKEPDKTAATVEPKPEEEYSEEAGSSSPEAKDEFYEDEEPLETEEYKQDVDHRASEIMASNFIAKYPRVKKEEVLEGLKEFDGNMIKVKEKLVSQYGEGCLQPFSEEEMMAKSREEFLPTYLEGNEVTEEFKEFYYNNDIQERIWKQIKEHSAEEYKEQKEAFERDFPVLDPNSHNSPHRPVLSSRSPYYASAPGGGNGIWEPSKINNEKLAMMEKSFPSIDRRILQYVLYNFSYQLADAISYLRKSKPECFVNISKPTEPTAPPTITVLPSTRPQAFQLPQTYKKGEKAQHENTISVIQLQEESSPGAKYSEIRRDADTYLKMMRIYAKNEALAHAAGQHSDAGRFKKLADDYYTMYNDAKRDAMVETIKQRNMYNNQLEKVDLHGLHAKEAEAFIADTLTSIKQRLKSGELNTGPQGVYVFKIITGVGKHSRELQARLQPTVRQYLKSRGYNFSEDKRKGIFDVLI